MVDHLAARRSTWRWDEIVLTALQSQAPAVQALEPAFRARGLPCESTIVGQCPYIALPGRWDDYLAALSSDDRYLVKRSLRDFDRWAAGSARVEVVRSHGELQRGKEILHRLHEHRWQAGGKAGVFVSPVFRRFHDMLMPALLDRGELDLRWLEVHGEPVAVSYCVINDDRVFFYQGGRATSVPKGVRPGIVLHLRAIRDAIESGRREYDFLAGDARYKSQLATHTRTLAQLRVTRGSLPETARAALAALARRRAASRAQAAGWPQAQEIAASRSARRGAAWLTCSPSQAGLIRQKSLEGTLARH